MSLNTELLELARQVHACDVRLSLMSPTDHRNVAYRRELEERRAAAVQRLVQLEAAHGWSTDAPPSTS